MESLLDYIKVYKNVIPHELCDGVIAKYKDNKNFNPQIIDMILNLQSSSAGRGFLQKVNAEKFVRITHQDLQEVQELVILALLS